VEATSTNISLSTLQMALAGRYAFERELGRGGMATVYLARDLTHDRYVAVKVLLPELAVTLGMERFLREIEVGTALQHPRIVGVLDSGSADGVLYYVMPFVEGMSLRDRLNKEKQLPVDDTIELTQQIADALAYAHSKGVIHRDIKPENILLDAKGGAMVADFGIARAVSVAGGETLTRTGMAVGTPTYMSPEQAMGSRDVTPESDIYSLACVVYELLAGQPPFTGPTAMALLARHSLDNVPSLKIVRGTVPDAVEDAIVRAMAKVPADRFRSATDFTAAMLDTDGAARRRRDSMRAKAFAAETVERPALGGGSKKKAMIAAAVAVPLLAAGGWFVAKGGGGSPRDARLAALKPSDIAVLYFDDRSPDKSLRYLSDGLTEALIHEIGQVKGLHVVSRNGVARFKNQTLPTDSVASSLSVGTIVSGTVTGAGDRVRVNVELTDARSGKTTSIDVEKTKQDAFALQDSLVREVSVFLRKQVGNNVQELVGKAGTRNAQAWDQFQRARQMIAQGDSLAIAGNFAAAVPVFARADSALVAVQALDPKWVAPASQRAHMAHRASRYAVSARQMPAVTMYIDSGLVAAEAALRLDANDADALEARGSLHYLQWLLGAAPNDQLSKLLEGAEKDLTASTKVNPAQASALNTLSHLYISTSRTTEANLTAQTAYTTDPYLTDANKTVWRLFSTSLDLDLGAQAKKWCAEGAARFPQDFRFVECQLWLLTLREQDPKPTADAIWKAFRDYTEANKQDKPAFVEKRGGMVAGIALLRAGLADSAAKVIDRSQGSESIDPGGDLMYLEVGARAQLGQKDRALVLLGKYLASHPQQRAVAAQDPWWWLDPLRNEPRYKALVGSQD
jgi:TolB-like protein